MRDCVKPRDDFGFVSPGGAVARRWEGLRAWWGLLAALLEEPRYARGLKGPEEVLAYLGKRRQDFSLAGYTAGEDGAPLVSDPVVFHRADEPMPLASTMKVVVLAAYAREVSEGRVDPAEPVALQEWERYYLPHADGGAHGDALEGLLGIAADGDGWAEEPGAEVPLDLVVRAMIEASDNAATDYLMQRLGDGKLRAVAEDAGLRGQEPILPILGTSLAWRNHDHPRLTRERLERLLSLDRREYEREARRLQRAYLGEAWGEEERRRLRKRPPLSDVRLESAVANRLETKGTARDYARIMAGVATGTFLSPGVSDLMRRHLGWPMRSSEVRRGFEAFGAKGGSLPGVLTGATFAVPKAGDFAGRPRVAVLFMRNMPLSAWTRLSLETLAQQEFERMLCTDRSFAGRVGQELEHREKAKR